MFLFYIIISLIIISLFLFITIPLLLYQRLFNRTMRCFLLMESKRIPCLPNKKQSIFDDLPIFARLPMRSAFSALCKVPRLKSILHSDFFSKQYIRRNLLACLQVIHSQRSVADYAASVSDKSAVLRLRITRNRDIAIPPEYRLGNDLQIAVFDSLIQHNLGGNVCTFINA